MCWQSHLRKIDRGEAGAVIAVFNKLLRDLDSYILLRFHGAATDVGCDDAIIDLTQG